MRPENRNTIASLSRRGSLPQVDQAYKTWPPSLQQLLYGMGFQMPRVRKNLCSLVVVMDPTTPSGAEAMQVRCREHAAAAVACRKYDWFPNCAITWGLWL